MKLANCIAIFTTVLVTALANADDPVTERGLLHTTNGQEIVDKSITRAVKLLGNTEPQLFSSWRLPKDATGKSIPIYLVESPQDSEFLPAAVPRGCRCIFINTNALINWAKRNSSNSANLELDIGNLLVFMLLHEVGHIKHATSGAAFSNGTMSQLNIEPSLAKEAEEDADNFAVDILKQRATQLQANDVSIDAHWIMTELSKLSWNMQAYRTLDEFGASLIGKPSVYFDDGYTHPNLAWRILHVNDRIQQNEDSRMLLQSFEQARERSAHPEPIYQRK